MEDGRTRIVCTVGPASAAVTTLRRMVRAGMDVARLNFSHGTHEDHAKLIETVRAAGRKEGKEVTILQDLQGPKIRIGGISTAGVTVREGEMVTFAAGSRDAAPATGVIPIVYERLVRDVRVGERILVDDGAIECVVVGRRGNHLKAEVRVGGLIKPHKGVNLPDSTVSVFSYTDQDREDVKFGVAHGVDWVCLSFVTSADDLHELRADVTRLARRHGTRSPKIMAKVERKMALININDIIEAADGIMLGRGDLGVEIPAEEVPVVQKDMTERCRLMGKPIIVATQMLESMREHPHGTRAEFSDVANAVFEHADAVMLSAETASGRYPEVAVQSMADVVRAAERSRYALMSVEYATVNCLPSAFAQTLAVLADRGLIGSIAVGSGVLPSLGSLLQYRPRVPVMALVPDSSLGRQLRLFYAVESVEADDHAGSLALRLRGIIKPALKRTGATGAIAYIHGTATTGYHLSILP